MRLTPSRIYNPHECFLPGTHETQKYWCMYSEYVIFKCIQWLQCHGKYINGNWLELLQEDNHYMGEFFPTLPPSLIKRLNCT